MFWRTDLEHCHAKFGFNSTVSKQGGTQGVFINDKEYCADFLRLEQGVHVEFSSRQNKQKRHGLEPFTA